MWCLFQDTHCRHSFLFCSSEFFFLICSLKKVMTKSLLQYGKIIFPSKVISHWVVILYSRRLPKNRYPCLLAVFFLQLLPYMDTILRYFHYMFEGKVITIFKKVMFHLAEIIFFLFKTMTESLQIKRHVIDFCFLEVSQVINLTSFRVQIFKQ